MNKHGKEIWRAIPGYKGLYSVSNLGRIRSRTHTTIFKDGRSRTFFGKILTPGDEGVRLKVILCKHGKQRDVSVHKAVLLAFKGPCPKGMECCHADGDYRNNKLENLRWDTHSSNYQDSIKHGTASIRENHHSAKLTWKKVKAIRAGLAAGESQNSLAKRFGVDQSNISCIKSGKTWNH